MKGSTVSTVRDLNRAVVLERIRQENSVSRAAIARGLQMSRSTVSLIVDQLLSEGFVQEVGTGESSTQGGRRPVQLQFVPQAKYAFGIDIGGTKTLFLLTDLDGNYVARRKVPSSSGDIYPLEHIANEAQRFLTDIGIDAERIVGTGIGISSTVDPVTGIVQQPPGLAVPTVNFRAYFAARLPNPIHVENDVNMAVFGEWWRGQGAGLQNVVMVAIGTGIGAGIVLNNQLYRGRDGYAGEIGHLRLDPYDVTAKRSLSDFGPLEERTSGGGLAQSVRDLLPDFPDSLLHDEPLTAQNVFAAEAQGDPAAVTVVQQAIAYLSFSIANLVTVLNPDVVILGGGVSAVGDSLIRRIRSRVQSLTPVTCPVVAAGLREDASAVGAAATALLHSGNLLWPSTLN